MADEEQARILIGHLRNHALENGGNFHYFSLAKVQELLGCSTSEALGAILFAEGRGWVEALRGIGVGVAGVSLRSPGFTEDGKSPSPAVAAPAVAANVHIGDVVHGPKAETYGDGSKIKQVSKVKSHDGDTNVSTRISFRARLRKIFGMG